MRNILPSSRLESVRLVFLSTLCIGVIVTPFLMQIGAAYAVSDITQANQTLDIGPSATTPILKLKWQVTGLPASRTGVLIADINGDGRDEIIRPGYKTVTALKGADGKKIWSRTVAGAGEWSEIQMGDINNDGKFEIVVPIFDPGGVEVLRAGDGSTLWRKTGLGGFVWGAPVIGDIDGNGYYTIFVPGSDVEHGVNGTGRITALTYDGKIRAQTFAWRPCGGGLSLADTDSDGEFELYSSDRDMYYAADNDYGKGVRSFWAKNLTVRWNHPDILCSSHKPILADVNKDGKLDVIVGHQRGGIAVLDSTDGGAIRKNLNMPDDAPVHEQPSVYDIDGDGNLEMMMADYHNTSTRNVVVWDLVRWQADARIDVGEYCYYGPQVADITGDGVMEMLVSSFHYLCVFDRDFHLIAKVGPLWGGWLTYPVVQDVDGDGYSEVVISTTGGRVYVFDTPARRPNPRPRTEVQFYSERRLGVAEYIPPPGETDALTSIVTNKPATSVLEETSQVAVTNTFTIAANSPPTQGTPRLVRDSKTGNLVCYNQSTFDADGDKVTNVYNWYRNGVSYTNLLLPFDVNSSSTAMDYSGYGNNGVIVRGVSWTSSGKIGGAYKFQDGWIRIPGSKTLDGGGAWKELTVEHWIYFSTDQRNTRTIMRAPSYEIGFTGTANKIFAGIWVRPAATNASGYRRVFGPTLSKNTWYHIVLSYKSGVGLKLYVNGASSASAVVSGNLQASGTEALYLGWFDHFKGIIDEVRIYPKALSSRQINQRYLETRGGSTKSSTLVSSETKTGDSWKCQVTPNDKYQKGTAKFSNTITIGSALTSTTLKDALIDPQKTEINDGNPLITESSALRTLVQTIQAAQQDNSPHDKRYSSNTLAAVDAFRFSKAPMFAK